MRRVCALAAVVTAALALAAGAGATSLPPWYGIHATLRFLPPIQLPVDTRHTSSCSVHSRRAPERIARTDRKMAPVACEQPPRSKVRDAGSSIVLAP
jgi:hypothetical protein